jgi:hypothetical protein
MYSNLQPNTTVNCFKKAGLYFNEEQCDGDICLDWQWWWWFDLQILADILNIDLPTTFQSYATIVDNVIVSGLL